MKTYVVVLIRSASLAEVLLMSTHNIGFIEKWEKYFPDATSYLGL